MRVVIVGGGVLGTMHAAVALRSGHEVVQVEREPAARGASVRNFGLIWTSGRAEGVELEAALRSRALWEELAGSIAALGFRGCGSLTVLRTEHERAVAEAALQLPSASERGFELLDAAATRARNPALRGELLGALWCERDAAVEPRTAQLALRAALLATPGYTWVPHREVRAVQTGSARDDHGQVHGGDVIVLCTGAWLGGLVRELAPELPVRRVRLQMMQTAPLGESLTTAVADADSLRYYPAFAAGSAAESLASEQPQDAVAAAHGMQLLMVQRADGGLTIGDTHAYDEPFDFDVDEAPYDHLARVASAILGRPLPPVQRRWAGVYAQTFDPAQLVHRAEVQPGVWLVTGPGGRGMTCSPAIAQDTLAEAGL